ncbi:MAG: hypothetical protein ACRDNJ_11065 [Solirubrobacteraceae bacterium]
MPRRPSHETDPAHGRLYQALRRAQQRLDHAQRDRDERAREAVDGGLSARSVASAVGTDAATAWRRWFRGER